jgi:hypothetical protein
VRGRTESRRPYSAPGGAVQSACAPCTFSRKTGPPTGHQPQTMSARMLVVDVSKGRADPLWVASRS